MINQPTLEQIKNDPRPKRMLSVKQVSEKTAIGVSTIWKMVAEGRFPKPLKYKSMDKTAWIEYEVEDWLTENLIQA